MQSNDIKRIYMFLLPLKNLAHKELRGQWTSPGCLISHLQASSCYRHATLMVRLSTAGQSMSETPRADLSNSLGACHWNLAIFAVNWILLIQVGHVQNCALIVFHVRAAVLFELSLYIVCHCQSELCYGVVMFIQVEWIQFIIALSNRSLNCISIS